MGRVVVAAADTHDSIGVACHKHAPFALAGHCNHLQEELFIGVGTGAQTYKAAVQIGRAAHFDAGSSAASQRCADMPHTTNYNPKDGLINLLPAQQVWAPMLQKHPPAAGGGLGFRINMNIPRKSPSQGSLRHEFRAPLQGYAERILGSPFG